MPLSFRPVLEAPCHRRLETNRKRPFLCIVVCSVVSFLILGIFGICAWNEYAHRFDWNRRMFHSGDEAEVGATCTDFSTHFCDGFTLELSKKAVVYLLPKQAKVNVDNKTTSSFHLRQLPHHPFNLKTSYLLKGSSIEAQACRLKGSPDIEAEIILIKGKGNFETWRKNEFCHDCVLKSAKIPSGSTVTASGNQSQYITKSRACASLEQKISKNDFYFLLIFYGNPYKEASGLHNYKKHHYDEAITLKGQYQRTHFDVSDAKKVCKAPTTGHEHGEMMYCTFDISWLSEKDIVFSFFERVGNASIPDDDYRNNRELLTKCRLRPSYWICIFVLVPVVACFCFSLVVGIFLCRVRKLSFEQINTRAENIRRENRRKERERRVLLKENTEAVAPDYGSTKIQT